MLFNMVWNQPEADHLLALLQHTKEQRELHQATSFAAVQGMAGQGITQRAQGPV